MKVIALAAAAAALFGSLAAASLHGHKAAHDVLHQLKRDTSSTANATCSCFTTIVTYYGAASLVQQPLTPTTTVSSTSTPTVSSTSTPTVSSTSTPTVSSTSTTTATVTAVSTPAGPFLSLFPTPGTYTVPASTVTLTTSTIVVAPTTTASYAAGTYTVPDTTVTVTVTNVYYFCPYTSVPPPPPPSTSAPAAAPISAAAPVSSAPAAFYAVSSSSSAPATSSSSASSSSASISPSNGNQWCITYSPYTASGACKDAGSVSSDISSIHSKGFNCVRIYSTDCSGLANVGSAAQANGMKLILGAYISSSDLSSAYEQVAAIAAWAQWSLVEFVVLGNEANFNNWCDGPCLAGFISAAKATLSAAGYTGSVTTAEPLGSWQDEGFASAVVDVVDVCCGQLHPFFNAQVTADQAGNFALSELQILEGICGSKPAYNCETGWPHQGEPNGAAVPGVAEQATAIASILEQTGSKAVMFDSWDSPWKGSGEFDVESYWGSLSCYGDSD